MTSAVSASAEGDTFYIATGTYAATNPKSGQHWIGSGWETVLQKNAFLGAVNLANVSCVTIENLKVQNTNSSGQGITTTSCTACVLERVWIDGPLDGAFLLGFHNGIVDQCAATSEYDAWVIHGRCVTVQNSIGLTTANRPTSDTPMGCFRTLAGDSSIQQYQVTFLNCQAFSNRSTSHVQPTVGWEVNSSCFVLLQNCTTFIGSIAEQEAGQMVAISAKDSGVCMAHGNCAIRSENAGSGGNIDLYQADSAIIQPDPSNTFYSTTSGAITLRIPSASPGASGGLTVVP
jgi:hypothetical protein